MCKWLCRNINSCSSRYLKFPADFDYFIFPPFGGSSNLRGMFTSAGDRPAVASGDGPSVHLRSGAVTGSTATPDTPGPQCPGKVGGYDVSGDSPTEKVCGRTMSCWASPGCWTSRADRRLCRAGRYRPGSGCQPQLPGPQQHEWAPEPVATTQEAAANPSFLSGSDASRRTGTRGGLRLCWGPAALTPSAPAG